MSQSVVPETDISPDIEHLVIEDDTPVDNLISEKQQRLLTEPLYSSPPNLFETDRFLVAANVGVFYAIKQPPLVPDVFLSLDVEVPQDWTQKKNRTYFVWEFGKAPDVAIEIVSNSVGNELGSKLMDYARMGVSYYIVFDPLAQLGTTVLQVFERRVRQFHAKSDAWLDEVGIGLTLWQGEHEGKLDRWLRWCDRAGKVIPTGAERAEQERQRAEQERQRAEQEHQRAEQEHQRAEQEHQRAEQERQRAEQAESRAEQLAERLRAMGIDPDTLEE